MKLFITAALSSFLLAFHCAGAHANITGRASAATVLLPSGDFMVIGGSTNPATNSKVETTEIYFTSSASWGTGQPMLIARSSHTATLLSDGRVLVAGGFNNNGWPLQSAELYNPVTDSWTQLNGVVNCTNRMCYPRGGHTATLINKGANKGKVLICGGQFANSGVNVSSTCELFHPASDSFSNAATMSSARIGHTASVTNKGTVFVSGGRAWDVSASTWVYLPTNELYDGSLTWTPVTSLNQGRAYHVATVLNNGNIMIAGGYAGGSSSATIYDSPEESWHSSEDGLPQQGGSHGYLGSAELFDPNGGRVQVSAKETLNMPYRVASQASLLMPDGTFHTHGGYGNIVPKFFSGSVKFEEDVRLYINRTGVNTATVDPDSELKFRLNTQLARTVDGRIVNGDFFISQPSKGGDPFASSLQDRGDPAIESDNMKVWLVRSTAPLDGSPVGKMIDKAKPGDFNDVIWPRYNNVTPGTVRFDQATVNSDNAAITASAFAFTGVMNPSSGVDLNPAASSLSVPVNFTVPAIYIGGTLVGTATIVSAAVTPSHGYWTLSLTGGVAQLNNVVGEDTETRLGLVSGTVQFTDLEGELTNNTTYLYFSSPLSANGTDLTSPSLEILYTVDGVNLKDLAYDFTVSTIVIRGMLYSDYLVFTPKESKWTYGQPLNSPIAEHNVVLTPGADMLMAGGKNCENPDDDQYPYANCTRSTQRWLASLGNPYDIYDTKVDWTSFQALTTKRAFHTSTLLPDGTILTCGGSDGGSALRSCELLSLTQQLSGGPSQKGWVFASSMTDARSRHTATLLPSGYVLAAGGTTGTSTAAVNTAEIYYPDTKRWVAVSTMSIPRQNHTATLLPDGNVLVAAGSANDGYSSSAELYITTAAIWQTVGALAGGRSQHTATLLKNGNVLVAGGVNGMGAVKTSEIYISTSRAWVPGPSMDTPRYSHTANLLKDGRVVVIGGSNNFLSQKTAEIYDGVSWKYVQIEIEGELEDAMLMYNRANHRTILLPNGKLMITGGEAPGVAQGTAEGFDVDFSSFQKQGAMQSRSYHTTVLTQDNMMLNIGGWDGARYLDHTDILYFSFVPDEGGVEPKTRNPVISTGTAYFDRGAQATLLGYTTNFHGMTEASGGGSGPANSAFSGPRVYMRSIDNPSGFLLDLTTRVYTVYGSTNADWEATLSSLTLTMPAVTGELPYGWYNVYAAANGMFSRGYTVQVTMPRPSGNIIELAGQVTGSTSVYWTWNADTELSTNNPLPAGYGIFSSSNSVFITTVAFSNPSYIQSGLAPNTKISIKVGAYNLGGYGGLVESPTYYTWAVAPSSLTVQRASFESATLSWDPAGNSPETPYEVTMWDEETDTPDPADIEKAVPFTNNFTSTFTTLTTLLPNKYYRFRVQAKNGAGILTGYSNMVTTITVDNVTNLRGTALSVAQINWAWDASDGDPNYEIYGVTGPGPNDAVFLGSSTVAAFTQTDISGTALSTNTAYSVRVNAYKSYSGTVRGPYSFGRRVHTLAATPLPGVPASFTSISTGGVTLNWIANGNPQSSTTYIVYANREATQEGKASSATVYVTDVRLPISRLLPNTSYTFEVAALNGDGIVSDPVHLGSMYTLAQSPGRLRPTAITMSGVTLEWDQGENPPNTVYELRGSSTSLITGPFMSPTPLPFSLGYTGNSYTINGLLTGTTYYFDVAARNRATPPAVTGRTQAVPSAFTLAGPDGAPSGSVGGTSDPAQDVTISGTLPNNRAVTINIPAGSFASQTAVAISSWAAGSPVITNPCGYQIGTPLHPLEVAIFATGGAQPQVPLTLTLKYDGESPGETHESTRIGLDLAKLVLARYNPVSGQCLPLETRIDTGLRTITATLDHFSLFQLMMKTAASNLSAVRVYPNPLYINRGPNLLTIDNMPSSAKVRIYTLSGDKVWEGTASTTGDIHWRGVNSSGYTVGSGIYLAVIDSTAGKKVVKIAVER